MKKTEAKVGVKVRVKKASTSHGYIVGKTYTIVEMYNDGNHARLVENGHWAPLGDMELYDRQSLAEAHIREAEELEAKAKDLRAKAERFARYKDDNDELAHLISETLTSGSDPAKIYQVLEKFGVKASLS